MSGEIVSDPRIVVKSNRDQQNLVDTGQVIPLRGSSFDPTEHPSSLNVRCKKRKEDKVLRRRRRRRIHNDKLLTRRPRATMC